jgi:hypothetical protein
MEKFRILHEEKIELSSFRYDDDDDDDDDVLLGRWGSSVNIVTRIQAGQPGLNSRQGQEIFLFDTASPQPPNQWTPGSPFP